MSLANADQRVEERRRAALAALASAGSAGLSIFEQAEQAMTAQQRQALTAARGDADAAATTGDFSQPIADVSARYQQALGQTAGTFTAGSQTTQGMTDAYMRELGAAIPLHRSQVEGDVARLRQQYDNQLAGERAEFDRSRAMWDMDMREREYERSMRQMDWDYKLRMAQLENERTLADLMAPKELTQTERIAAARGAGEAGRVAGAQAEYDDATSDAQRNRRNRGRVSEDRIESVAEQIRRYYPTLTEQQARQMAVGSSSMDPDAVREALRSGRFTFDAVERPVLSASRLAAGDEDQGTRTEYRLRLLDDQAVPAGVLNLLTPEGQMVDPELLSGTWAQVGQRDERVGAMLASEPWGQANRGFASRFDALRGIYGDLAREGDAIDARRAGARDSLARLTVPADVQAQRDAYTDLFGGTYGPITPYVAAGLFESPSTADRLRDAKTEQEWQYALGSMDRNEGLIFTSPQDERAFMDASNDLGATEADRALAAKAGLPDPSVVPALRSTPEYQYAASLVASMLSKVDPSEPVSEEMVRQMFMLPELDAVPLEVVELVIAENRSRFMQWDDPTYSEGDLRGFAGFSQG